MSADLRALTELFATVSGYGIAIVVGALWLGIAVRVGRAVAGIG